jgi:rubredoxin
VKPGDKLVTDDGRTFVLGTQVAAQGKEGCTDPGCTRINGVCVGWHCPVCGAPTSSFGHGCTGVAA